MRRTVPDQHFTIASIILLTVACYMYTQRVCTVHIIINDFNAKIVLFKLIKINGIEMHAVCVRCSTSTIIIYTFRRRRDNYEILSLCGTLPAKCKAILFISKFNVFV